MGFGVEGLGFGVQDLRLRLEANIVIIVRRSVHLVHILGEVATAPEQQTQSRSVKQVEGLGGVQVFWSGILGFRLWISG